MTSRAITPERRLGVLSLSSACAFASAALSYWLEVFPTISRELRRWRVAAHAIPDPLLREQALQALTKRGNMEGAAAFATFAPHLQRTAVIRATVAFQSAYNYLDVLVEQPTREPFENSLQLHQALRVALDPSACHVDYYARHGYRDDGGYLHALVNACRSALAELRSYELVAPAAQRAAERVITFQAHQASGDEQGYVGAMERWAYEQSPAGAGLLWWETAGACGSSLGVHAMIAEAAERRIEPARIEALERAYHPWIGALHTMLDHFIDAQEDAATHQRSLIACYASEAQAATRMGTLAARALQSARSVSPGGRHELIVAAMASFYLSAPQASEQGALLVSRAVLEALGPLTGPALKVFDVRSRVRRLYYAGRSHGDHHATAKTLALLPGHR